jgi:Abortive infection alpha
VLVVAKKSADRKKPTRKPGQAVAAGRGKVADRALGPAADELGKELAPLGKEIGEVSVKVGRMLLLPIKGLVGGLERVGAWLGAGVTTRLKNVPEDKIVAPSARVAVPAVQALVYSMDDELIRELFANLLASDMNADKKSSAHPAFVEIVKEMRSEDARVFLKIMESPEYRYVVSLAGSGLLHFTDVEFSFDVDGMDRFNIAYSLDNLQRLALVEMQPNKGPVGDRFTERRESAMARRREMADSFNKAPEGKIGGMQGPFSVHVEQSGIYTTGFGVEFWKACMNEREGAVIPKAVKRE